MFSDLVIPCWTFLKWEYLSDSEMKESDVRQHVDQGYKNSDR